ncbi:MAG: acyl-CoA carboxylase subunit beta [Cytophagaceae bacterium]|jgi:acetyl-CoA carboxylase carboxyltransferase component|nr:acyl-CoA carboxylase subunit beta [Cytophagaceae bacterium]
MEPEILKNKESLEQLCQQLTSRYEQVKMGGGAKKIAEQHEKGKWTARERIAYLLDKDTETIEIGALAAEGMYEEFGGCPSAGVVVVIGKVEGRLCVVVANDATVKAGAWFPMTAKKNLRAQEIAMENKIPIIYLVDSAGVFLPLQQDVFPDKEHFGRIFRNNSVMSSMGIVQIAAIMGSCVAGGAYLPILSDEALIVDKTGSVFLAGSYLVKSAIGEDIDNESLGGATTHCEISGVTDHKCENDQVCLDKIRSMISKMGHSPLAGFDRADPKLPAKDPQEILSLLPADRSKPYDMMELLERIIDAGSFDEYKALYGKSMICGLARIDGWAVGIVANQRKIVKTKTNEMQMGGVIYSDAADKAARFIMNCNQKKIPLLFLHDVTGFMVGSRSEMGGIIKDGAKMVNAMSNSVVPKFTILVGNSFGAGNYAMCGKAYDPRLIFAWPTAQMAVMGGAAAAKTLLQIKVASLKAKGKEITPEEESQLLNEIKGQYEEQLSPYYAAARLWTDGIIHPLQTRTLISMGIEMANQNAKIPDFNVGVIQT